MPFRTFLKCAALIGGLSLTSGAALAEPMTFQCIVKGGDSGWIAEQMFFEYDSAGETARVVDPIILHFDKEPKVAEVSENTQKKLVIKWRLNARTSSQTTKFAYRLAFFKSNGKVTVQAHPHGFVNNFSARGRCQQIRQALPAG